NKQMPPYEYLNEYDMFKGFNVDLMNALAIETNCDIELYPMSWTLARMSVAKGHLDGLQGVPRTHDDALEYAFTAPYLTVRSRLAVRRETTHIINLEDLRGRRVAVERDGVAHRLLARYRDVEVVVLNNEVEVIESLLAGEVDAAVAYDATARYVAEKWRRVDELKMVGEPVFTADYCIALRKGEEGLALTLDRGIKALKKNGVYAKIYEKWFGATADKGIERYRRYIYPALGVLCILALVAGGSLRWNYVLRREVRRRTMELKESNARLEEQRQAILKEDTFKQQVLDSVGSGIVTLDREGRVVSMNEPARLYLSRSGPGAGICAIVDASAVDECMRSGRAVTCTDRETLTAGGRKQFMSVNVYPLLNVERSVDGAIVVFFDETEKKRLREQVHRQNKLEALGQMLAGAAHEIRNPLSAIKNFTDLLPRKFDVPSFRDEFLRHVPVEVARLDRLVSDLLNFARPSAPVPEVFRVGPLFESVVMLFREKARARGVSLEVRCGDEQAYADPSQMKQVLINLMLNALDWVNAGGRVLLQCRTEDKDTMLFVSDNGKGMGPEVLEAVYDPFFTLRPGGVGLGLSLCHHYVTDNAGTIEIESEPGKGTIVRIALPSMPPLKGAVYR
ncbi:MAG: transporter substrate-binding domain-containing protein, partial [Bacillota bacterium]